MVGLLRVPARLGFGVGVDFLKRVLNQFAVFAAGAVLQNAGIHQRDEYRGARQDEAEHPIQDKRTAAEPIFEQGFTSDKH